MMKWIIFCFVPCVALSASVVVDYPRNTQEYDEDYNYQNEQSAYQQNYYNYNNSGVETGTEAINRQYEQQAETLLQSNPDQSSMQQRLDAESLKQDAALRNSELKQQQNLDRN